LFNILKALVTLFALVAVAYAAEEKKDDVKKGDTAELQTSETGYGAPYSGYPAAAYGGHLGYSQTGYGHAAPAYRHAAPAYGHAAPAYGHAAPAYGHAAPAYGHVAPAYGHVAPAAYGHVAPAYGHAGGYGHAAAYGGHSAYAAPAYHTAGKLINPKQCY
jgi:hypothetical protein